MATSHPSLTIHPAGFGDFGDSIDFSSLAVIAPVASRAFFINTGVDVLETDSKAQMEVKIEDKITAYGWGGTARLAVYSFENMHLDEWPQATMIDCHNACHDAAGAESFTWIPYYFSLTNMYAAAPADMDSYRTQNDGYSTYYAALAGRRLGPDFYAQTASVSAIPPAVELNWAEAQRILTLSGAVEAVPVIYTYRPNPTWEEAVPVEPDVAVALIQSLILRGATNIVVWSPDAATSEEAETSTSVIESWSEGWLDEPDSPTGQILRRRLARSTRRCVGL